MFLCFITVARELRSSHRSVSFEGDEQEARLTARKLGIAVVALSILLVLLDHSDCFSLITFRKSSDSGLVRSEPPPPAAFQLFWKPFASGPEEPWVVFQ